MSQGMQAAFRGCRREVMGSFLESLKDSPLEPQEGMQLDDLFQTSDLWNYKIICACSFKPLGLCWFVIIATGS